MKKTSSLRTKSVADSARTHITRTRRKRKPSVYESEAIRAIHNWKTPRIGWFGRTLKVIKWPLSKAQEVASKLPGADQVAKHGKPAIEWVIDKSVGGLVRLLNGAALWTVRPKAIYTDFRGRGHRVHSAGDIFALDLEDVDRSIGWLSLKYETLCAAEGGATGTMGLPGIPADIVALIGLNLRAIGEYATYCGFEVSKQEERLFALNILSFASSPADASKQIALAQLIRVAKDVAAKKTWAELNKHSFVKIVRQFAETFAIRLTKAKLAQAIPYLGGGIGAGFNAYYTSKVCEAAANLYRERFLAAKYGPQFIEETIKPAREVIVAEESEVREILDGA
jgi:EcsC protein family